MKNRHCIILICGILLTTFSACTSTQGAQTTDSDKRNMASDIGMGDSDLIRIASDARKLHKIPAIAAAAVTSKGIQKACAVGTRKRGTDVPVTLDDMWHLGSDGKIMTSTLAAILICQGKLKWTSTVSEVFPELADGFTADFKNATLLQLLSHRAGLPRDLDYQALTKHGSVREQRIEAVKEGLRLKPLGNPILSTPALSGAGTPFLYSNLGYIIAGAMIERASGMDWESAMTMYVFDPLSMSSAGFGGFGTRGEIDQPWGHVSSGNPFPANGPDVDSPPVAGPAGRIHCTIQDWAKFIADQLRGARGEPALLKPDDYRMLQEMHFTGNYALGWSIANRDWAGGRVLTHAGSNGLYFAVAWVAPIRDFAVLVCVNEGLSAEVATDDLVSEIVKTVVRQ
jgi:CubicO group peptidase (beta-lactamase class C family)